MLVPRILAATAMIACFYAGARFAEILYRNQTTRSLPWPVELGAILLAACSFGLGILAMYYMLVPRALLPGAG